ncbi:MAG: metallophosphoesterase [Proteobacteria bacterium]|jgi:serine/threonine protein phosphatase 1|nr:metallophosphoesterase [Pseudomonadota bacterium]
MKSDNPSSNVLRLSKNPSGRDFVVGDIHGCFDLLKTRLRKLGFDKHQDRLISVGDLIDHGQHNDKVLVWLDKPWFYAVRGNHETLAIQSAKDHRIQSRWYRKGGAWATQVQKQFLKKLRHALTDLPFAIEVRTRIGKVGIVHADVPVGLHWRKFLAALEQHEHRMIEYATWGRTRQLDKCTQRIKGVQHVYVGHTPVAKPTTLGNVTNLDTCAHRSRNLSIVEITSFC